MLSRQRPAQRKTVERVMPAVKHGELETARGARRVKDRKQAVAIALHEAGGGGTTRAELCAEARRLDIPGRSKMDKRQLERALHQ